MEKGLKQFITSNSESRLRWREFKEQNLPSVFDIDRVEELTPFFNTRFYSELTEQQKNEIYAAFIQFTAEALIFLELILYEGVRALIQKSSDDVLIKASRKIMLEEKDHTKAFIRFLKDDCPGFATKSYLLRNNRRFKNGFLWLARHFPVGLALPAAKVEAYTVFYGKALQNAFSDRPNSWSQLNVLHLMDESLHIGYEFDMYEFELQRISGLRRLIALAATLGCVMLLQVCSLMGCYRMVRSALKTKGFWESSRWTLRLGGWILREFAPYRQTRKFLKNQFQARQPLFRGVLGFMYK